MAARKASKSVRRRAPKKQPAKKAIARGSRKAAARKRRRAGAGAPGKDATAGVSSVGAVGERKPAKKAEPRPNRPPAALPIPQSTFFF